MKDINKTSTDALIELLVNDSLYIINDDGTIKTLKKPNGRLGTVFREVRQTKSNNYLGITYRKKFILVHRILYRKFMGTLESGKVINHIDGVRSNNKLSNLELVSYSENSIHAYSDVFKRKSGVRLGVNNHSSKLSNDQVVSARELYRAKKIKISELARQYSVSRITIRNMLNKVSYTNV